MEFTSLILSRESVRNYDPDRPIPKEILGRILDAGRLAPSAANRQPWKFLVISSAPMLDKVRACYNREWFKAAPHFIVVVGLADQAWIRKFDGYNSIETDVTIAMTHILLAAENEGLGCCWVAAYDPALLGEALKPRDNERIFGILPIGYPKQGFQKASAKNRKSLEDIVEYL